MAITDAYEAQARFDQSKASEITACNAMDNALEVCTALSHAEPGRRPWDAHAPMRWVDVIWTPTPLACGWRC